jgi:LEA14-like dessication related protein
VKRVPDARVGRGRTRRRLATLLAIGLGAAASTACGGLVPPRNLQPPTLAFSDLSIDSVSAERVRFTVTIATQNPNAIDLPLSNLYFDLAILGQQLAQGKVTDQQFTLPANGSRDVPVALTVATADLRAVLGRMISGSLPDTVWELKGTANWGWSPLPIPFQKRGDAAALRRLRELLRF